MDDNDRQGGRIDRQLYGKEISGHKMLDIELVAVDGADPKKVKRYLNKLPKLSPQLLYNRQRVDIRAYGKS